MSDDRLASIEAIVMDVDGVLTDGTFVWSTSGEEFKRFSFEDVMGASRARQAGLRLGLISGEDSALVDLIAKKMCIENVVKGCKAKGDALSRFARTLGISMEHVAFVGDDINDLPALVIAGFSAAPANAQPQVKAVVDLVLQRNGGHGAVREFVEMVLAAHTNRIEAV